MYVQRAKYWERDEMPFPHFISLCGRGFRALRFAAAKRPGGGNAGRAWRQSGPAVPATALRERAAAKRPSGRDAAAEEAYGFVMVS